MSIQGEIDRINQNIADTYSVLSDAGAATPTAANSENLAATAAGIAAVLYNKAQGLTDTQKEQARTNIGALAESELDNAVNDALAQAKESGEFNGEPGAPGISVTVSSVTESTEDGGTNVVNFSDGTKLNVKNGRKGSDGAPGATGAPGPAGAGVKSMTYNSSTNKWTVTLTDNTTITVDGPAIPDLDFVVTFAPDATYETYTADKTYDETIEAINNGRRVVGRCGLQTFFPTTLMTGYAIIFSLYNGTGSKSFRLKADNSVLVGNDDLMTKFGGTFTGAVAVGAASASGYYVRNIKFSETAETPTTEGDICFKLK